MNEDDKAQLIKDIFLLRGSTSGIDSLINPELINTNKQRIGFASYCRESRSNSPDPNSMEDRLMLIDFKAPSKFEEINTSKFIEQVIPILKSSNAVLDPEFGVYVLLASIGEEGEDDNCLLNSIQLGGRPLHFKYTSKHKLNSSNISVEITPLPRNRAKINYTITAVPEGATGITFKATY